MPSGFPRKPPAWSPVSVRPNVLPTPHVPEAVPQEAVVFPAGVDPLDPEIPYGMGDARCFLDIPPLVHFPDGSTCINPDYAALYRFSRSAVARDPGAPGDRNLVPEPLLPANETVEFQLTVEREENGMGHFLIDELFMFTSPETAVDGIFVEAIKYLQGDMTFNNARLPAVHVFGTSFLSCCLPCPIMLYPNQTLIFSVTNESGGGANVRIQARGRRFMPYHDMRLVQEMERCWEGIQTVPYWLTFDEPVRILAAAGGVSGEAQGQMSVPGGGFFEMGHPMVQVVPDAAGVAATDLLVDVTDGRIGKRFMDGPINLGAHWASDTLTIAGFPGNLYRAVQACHCPPVHQLVRGNTRLIHNFENPAADNAFIRMTYSGCYHYADRCPPKADLDLVRRYGGSNANELQRIQASGDRAYEAFLDENPLYVQEPCDEPEVSSPQGSLGALESHGDWEAI